MATIKNGTGTLALCAFDTDAKLRKHEFGRPEPGPNDVSIDIQYCGMCHSDLHACNGDWGLSFFPIAPGHEIAGVIQSVGKDVTDFKEGDKVGVGCFIDSCFDCEMCKDGQENFCSKNKQTYGNQYEKGMGHDDCADCHTNGGYTSQITVRKDFVYHAPKGMDLKYVGPLLCAGITTFSPLNRHVLQQKGKKSVAIVGFGGLGQMGVKIAKAMGADVTVLSRSTSKKDEANALGADIVAHTDEGAMKEAAGRFNVILDTVAVSHDAAKLLSTLKVGGTYVCIGGVPKPIPVSPMTLISRNLKMEGSLVGGIPETQEMLDFCAKHDIKPEIKVIDASDAPAQFEALAAGTTGAMRAVIDMKTLANL